MIRYIGQPNFLFNEKVFITNINKLAEFVKDKKQLCLDIEANSLDPINNKIWFVQIGDKEEQFVINYQQLTDKDKHILREILTSDIIWIGHNLKYDTSCLKVKLGIDIENIWDTLIADKVIFNGIFGLNFGLKDLVKKYCNKELSKTQRDNFVVENYTPTIMDIEYSANDLIYLEYIKVKQETYAKEYGLEKVIELEMKAVSFYRDIEINGIPINFAKWEALTLFNIASLKVKENEIVEEIIKLITEKKIDKETGLETDEYLLNKKKKSILLSVLRQGRRIDIFTELPDDSPLSINLSSSKDKMNLLVNVFEVDITKRFKGGIEKESADSDILERYKDIKLINLILEWTELKTQITKFGYKFLENINKTTGNIHTNFFQLGTDTGRVSCNKPNLQQIPANKNYRSCFEAPEHWKIITADYDSCELRIIATLTGEQAFISAINNKEDLHSKVASMVFGVPVSKTENKELRQIAKIINFGLAYGMDAHKLSDTIAKPLEECKRIIENYFKQFPKIKSFLNKVADEAIITHCSRTTPYNRVRWYEIDEMTNFKEKEAIKRKAKNMPIQGCNADLIKLASINLRKKLKEYKEKLNIEAYIIHQVHDEIVVLVKEENVPIFNSDLIGETKCGYKEWLNISSYLADVIKDIMKEAGKEFSNVVEFEVDVKISQSWTK